MVKPLAKHGLGQDFLYILLETLILWDISWRGGSTDKFLWETPYTVSHHSVQQHVKRLSNPTIKKPFQLSSTQYFPSLSSYKNFFHVTYIS